MELFEKILIYVLVISAILLILTFTTWIISTMISDRKERCEMRGKTDV